MPLDMGKSTGLSRTITIPIETDGGREEIIVSFYLTEPPDADAEPDETLQSWIPRWLPANIKSWDLLYNGEPMPIEESFLRDHMEFFHIYLYVYRQIAEARSPNGMTAAASASGSRRKGK